MATSASSHIPSRNAWRWTALFPTAVLLTGIALLPRVSSGEALHWGLPWVPSLGVALSFSVDGLGLLMSLIVAAVGAVVSLYAADYLAGHPYIGRFYLILFTFMSAMIGLVLCDNLLALFVFWELTTVTSYLLIGFDHDAPEARANARQALLVTAAGGLALLIGILLLGAAGGSYSISALARKGDLIRSHALYMPILMCFLAGAFTKSAQFPFHFWLPNAMTAPTPISAFLHSATMVKAGVYLLARVHPILGGTPAWMQTLVLVGGVTALLGSVMAVGQHDLKKVLAYTTIMALGVITMFLGGKTTPALTAAVTFLLVHALYKSALFLAVGIIDHETGTRIIERLGGLSRAMPFTAAATAAAALSMAGFPLFFGFIGKEIMYKGALTEEVFPVFATAAALISNALMTAVAGVLALRSFFGPKRGDFSTPKEAAPVMWIGPLVLGLLGIVFGIFPDWVSRNLVTPAVLSFHATTEVIQLKLFYGFNEPLLLSMATLLLGVLFYLGRRRIRTGVERFLGRLPVSGHRAYGAALDALAWAADRQTRFLQNGSLHRYLFTIAAAVLVGAAVPLLSDFPSFSPAGNPGIGRPEWLLLALVGAALAAVVVARSRLAAVCGLGVIGAGIALLFLIHGAPDVALTQLLVETLTVIIVSLVLLRLPRLPRGPDPQRRRWIDALLAGGLGTLVTILLLAVDSTELDRSLTGFFESNSLASAHGRNIVNVILVDFRSLDTLGEIAVVVIAGLAAVALIRQGRTGP